MDPKIESILEELKKSTSKLDEVVYQYYNKYDYYNESDRAKIAEFENKFNRLRDEIDTKIVNLVKFVEKCFAPSKEELAKIELRKKHSGFDNWPKDAQQAFIDQYLNSNEKPQTTREKTPTSRTYTAIPINNPTPDKRYPITYNFTFCKPYAIDFCGKKIEVSAWTEVLYVIASELYNKNPQPLLQYMNSNYSEFRPRFTNNENILRRAMKISDGIYAEANLSANDIFQSVQILLDIYSIDSDQIGVYLSRISNN